MAAGAAEGMGAAGGIWAWAVAAVASLERGSSGDGRAAAVAGVGVVERGIEGAGAREGDGVRERVQGGGSWKPAGKEGDEEGCLMHRCSSVSR